MPVETILHNIILGEDFLKGIDIRLRQCEIINIEKITKELQAVLQSRSSIGRKRRKKILMN